MNQLTKRERQLIRKIQRVQVKVAKYPHQLTREDIDVIVLAKAMYDEANRIPTKEVE